MRWSSLPFWLATSTYLSSGDGTAAWAWTPTSTQPTGLRPEASKNTTWPLATLASTACVRERLKSTMWGRTGAVPVRPAQSCSVSPPRSTFSGASSRCGS